MTILLDECVDWRFLRDLPNHDVKTVRQKSEYAWMRGHRELRHLWPSFSPSILSAWTW